MTSMASDEGGVCWRESVGTQQQGVQPHAWAQRRRWQAGGTALTALPCMGALFSEQEERIQSAVAAAAAAGVKLDLSPELQQLLRSADAFTFDVDSTL